MRSCAMQKSPQETRGTAPGKGGGAPSPGCAGCGTAMEHVATLPQTPSFPMQHFYRCLACRQVAKIEED
jgi:hypothetical protein